MQLDDIQEGNIPLGVHCLDLPTGHQRLWHYDNDMVLAVSSLYMTDRVAYTTAVTCTFYLKTVCGDDYVILPTYLKTVCGDNYVILPTDGREFWNYDGREFWNYGIQNKQGTFEFQPNPTVNTPPSYHVVSHNWKLLDGCFADYSELDLCPNRHEALSMGLDPVRNDGNLL